MTAASELTELSAVGPSKGARQLRDWMIQEGPQSLAYEDAVDELGEIGVPEARRRNAISYGLSRGRRWFDLDDGILSLTEPWSNLKAPSAPTLPPTVEIAASLDSFEDQAIVLFMKLGLSEKSSIAGGAVLASADPTNPGDLWALLGMISQIPISIRRQWLLIWCRTTGALMPDHIRSIIQAPEDHPQVTAPQPPRKKFVAISGQVLVSDDTDEDAMSLTQASQVALSQRESAKMANEGSPNGNGVLNQLEGLAPGLIGRLLDKALAPSGGGMINLGGEGGGPVSIESLSTLLEMGNRQNLMASVRESLPQIFQLFADMNEAKKRESTDASEQAVGAQVPCAGCGQLLGLGEGVTEFSCPKCSKVQSISPQSSIPLSPHRADGAVAGYPPAPAAPAARSTMEELGKRMTSSVDALKRAEEIVVTCGNCDGQVQVNPEALVAGDAECPECGYRLGVPSTQPEAGPQLEVAPSVELSMEEVS